MRALDTALEAEAPSAASAGVRVFGETTRVGLGDVAPSGRARLDAVARWLQDAAYADLEDAGLVGSALWVLRRARLQVRRFPRHGERVAIETYCSGLGRVCAERRTTFRTAAGGLVEALTLWAHLDPVSLRPASFSPREVAIYGAGEHGSRVRGTLRHPAPHDATAAAAWRFFQADLDLLGHVNNAAYWRVLEERLLAGPEPAAIDAEAEHRTAAHAGEYATAERGSRLWLLSADGAVHTSFAWDRGAGSAMAPDRPVGRAAADRPA